MIHFPVSNVETYWWLPPLVAFGISCLTSTGGLSGAFLLLPFQVSVLGFSGPAVSSTNLVFNVVAIPGGVYQYYRERRMVWPLVWAIILGSLPGIFLGALVRVTYLPDPHAFKPFVGLVLAYVGFRLLKDVFFKREEPEATRNVPSEFTVTSPVFTTKRVSYEFNRQLYNAPTWGIIALSFVVGVIGGAYGIGGGAIIAPFFVTVFRLPVYTIAGAALLSTLVSSIMGILSYVVVAGLYSSSQMSIIPDWGLGALFGIGGAAGVYIGARLQRFIPARLIKAFLALCVLVIAVKYLWELLG